MPGAAHGPREESIGFRIVDELLLCRVPANGPAKLIGHIAQMADGYRSGAHGYRRAGLTARLDGLDVIRVVVFRLVQMQLIGADFLMFQLLRPGFEIVAPYGHFALRSKE